MTGESAAGARLPLSGHGDRILDVVASAGGNRSRVSETFVRLSRGKLTATVPVTSVVSNPKENIYLRPNDVLTLVRAPQAFTAVGTVGAATELPFSAYGITLAQALAKARGLSDFQADPAGTFIFRFEPAAVVRRLSPGLKLLGTPLVPVVYRIDMREPTVFYRCNQTKIGDLYRQIVRQYTVAQKILGGLVSLLLVPFNEFNELVLRTDSVSRHES